MQISSIRRGILIIFFISFSYCSKDTSVVSLENNARIDEWFAIDKAQHFMYSTFVALGSQYALVNKLGKNVSECEDEVYTTLNMPVNYISLESLTPEQIMLRMMEKDSKLRLDSMTMRTYLWFIGMIGIFGGTIYLINKNKD